ncbi:MAG: ergothioneine biosynthesis protein EgtC [Trebonia sp.]|jgi:glutamine amidotransferase
MCRHLAYLGPPTALRSVLIDPPHGLYRQAWAPRLMRHGTVNADGFGVGWYADGDPAPARYRRTGPIWADESLPGIARVTRSAAVLAAVRNATAGMAAGEQAAAPFASGPWLFSHNGVLAGWPASAVSVAETAGTSAATLLSLEAMVDSAFLWALALERLRAARSMAAALAETIGAVEAAGATGRFNFLLTDGRSIAATACGDTLWYRRSNGSVLVASEPGDDDPGWTEVPDRQVLTATPSLVSVRPLTAGTGVARADGPVARRTGSSAASSSNAPSSNGPSSNAPSLNGASSDPPSLNEPTTTSATKGFVTR